MKTSLYRIITKDNLELVGLLYEPDAGSRKVLVHVHGMSGNFYENEFLDFIAQTLTNNGVALFVFNNRGCELVKDLIKIEGGKRNIVQIGNAYEKFEDCVLDIKAAMDFIASKGFSEIHLSGHSLGAPKVAYYGAVEKDNQIKSIIFLSPADMVGGAKADKNYERNIAIAKKMIREGKGRELMPFVVFDDCHHSAGTYMSLGDEHSPVAIFNFYDHQNSLQTLSQITVPALTIMGRKDAALIIPIEDTMDRIKKAMTNSPRVETIILADADHQYHNYEQQLAEAINTWIQKM